MGMEISVSGINHSTAPVDVRECMALSADQARQLLRAIRADGAFEEALVLCTCNRTEVYFTTSRRQDAFDRLHRLLVRVKQASVDPSWFYRLSGPAAVVHMLSVASSLDSQVLGESQILNQLKSAYRVAREEQMIRFMLNKLVQRAFRAGKRVRTETDLGGGSPSIAQAAVDFCRRTVPDLPSRSVLLVGAGRTAELAAQAFVRCGVMQITVANRTLERARQVADRLRKLSLAWPAHATSGALPRSHVACSVQADEPVPPQEGRARLGVSEECSTALDDDTSWAEQLHLTATAIGLDDIPSAITSADLVLCCTSSPGLVLTRDALASAIQRPADRPLHIVDVAVPRDADPQLGHLPNVFLYDIDDLGGQTIRATNQQAVARAKAIVDHEAGQFARWLDSLRVTPTIKLLQERFDLLQQAEVRKFEHKVNELDRLQLEYLTRRLCKKIMHKPLAFLHSLPDEAATGDDMAAIEFIRRMFDLDSLEDRDEPDRSQNS